VLHKQVYPPQTKPYKNGKASFGETCAATKTTEGFQEHCFVKIHYYVAKSLRHNLEKGTS
jgi:hypothetical protein